MCKYFIGIKIYPQNCNRTSVSNCDAINHDGHESIDNFVMKN